MIIWKKKDKDDRDFYDKLKIIDEKKLIITNSQLKLFEDKMKEIGNGEIYIINKYSFFFFF